jgi:hypothetical protein
MEVRMPNARRSVKNIEPIEEEELVEISGDEVTIIDEEIEETVPVRLMKQLIVKVTGNSTGKIYIFNGAGSIVNVNKSDLEIINKKNKTHPSCCGSYSSPYFDIL